MARLGKAHQAAAGIGALREQFKKLLKLLDCFFGKGLVAVAGQHLLIGAHAAHVNAVINLLIARVQAPEIVEKMRSLYKFFFFVMTLAQAQFGKNGIGAHGKFIAQFFKNFHGLDIVPRAELSHCFIIHFRISARLRGFWC